MAFCIPKSTLSVKQSIVEHGHSSKPRIESKGSQRGYRPPSSAGNTTTQCERAHRQPRRLVGGRPEILSSRSDCGLQSRRRSPSRNRRSCRATGHTMVLYPMRCNAVRCAKAEIGRDGDAGSPQHGRAGIGETIPPVAHRRCIVCTSRYDRPRPLVTDSSKRAGRVSRGRQWPVCAEVVSSRVADMHDHSDCPIRR